MTGPTVVKPEYCIVCHLKMWNGTCQTHGNAESQAAIKALQPAIVEDGPCSVCGLQTWRGSCRTHGDAAAQAEYKARTPEQWAEIAAKDTYWRDTRAAHGLRYGGGGESLRQRAERADKESDSPAGDEVQS